MVLALAAVSLSAPATAHAQTGELQVAIYAPWSGPSTADARHELALAIEHAIQGRKLGPVAVSSYAKFRDFRRAVRAGKVDIAVVDTGAALELASAKEVTVLSSWSSGDGWILAGAQNVADPRQKVLALAADDAPSSQRVLDRLLRNQVSRKYWAGVVGAPVTADARELVTRGKADLVVLPARAADGLRPLLELGTFSELALVIGARKTASALAPAAEQVETALRARLGGTWSAGSPALPSAFSPRKFAAAEPAPLPAISALFRPWAQAPAELALDDMWIEPDAP